MTAADLARTLAEHTDRLAPLLLPGGHLERNRDWRCGSVAGEAGTSLIVSLAGNKRGHWRDFATGEGGDMLDLVAATQNLKPGEAMTWARRWLGIDQGESPIRQNYRHSTVSVENPDRWRAPWQAAVPIAGTLAEAYLTGRGLTFRKLLPRHDGIGVVSIEAVDADPHGDVLRFTAKRARRSPDDTLEHHPALLALLRNVLSGEPCGVVNVYLLPDGRDRLRDKKGKTVTGKAGSAAVMLGEIEDIIFGLTICEGTETAIAIEESGQSPVWALGGAGNLATFPVLDGIEALTVAADTGTAGQKAAREVAARWRKAGREVRTITPPTDDWADEARSAR